MAQATKTHGSAQALIDRLAASRQAAGEEIGHLRQKLDVPSRLRSSLAERPGLWMGGSLGTGFMLSRTLKSLFRRPKKTAKSSGWLALLFGAIMAAAKPLLRDYALRTVRHRFLTPGPSGPVTRPETRFPLSKP